MGSRSVLGYDLRVSFSQIEGFLAVAEAGSVTSASRRLHISQPPLTRKIRELEAELGVTLFERGPRGVRLSAAGARFVPYARSIVAAVLEGARAARGEPLAEG